jgi:tRNA modification GTPase
LSAAFPDILITVKTEGYNLRDSIAALASPWGESAVAVIRTSGEDAVRRADRVFRSAAGGTRLSALRGFRIIRGCIVDPDTEEEIDDILAAVYRGPNSYTGEDSVELFVHGSLPGIERILEALHRSGFRDANPGEFTLRAFLNGKLDLTRAEAVNEIVTAKSKQAQSLALHRLTGSVERAVNGVKDELTGLVAAVELQLDYSEDEGEAEDRPVSLDRLRQIRKNCRELAATFAAGRLYQQGLRVALAGKTNAGKSSLFNLFLKEDRSIVSEIHGTTRDYIESWITLHGVPVLLYDTAGLRAAENPVEHEGIRRTEEVIGQSDIVLYVVDAAAGEDGEDRRRTETLEGTLPCVRIWNKTDSTDAAPPPGYLPLSTVTMEGFHDLENAVVSIAAGPGLTPSPEGGAVIDSLRQKELLQRAEQALGNAEQAAAEGMPLDMTAAELRDALRALGEITGEVTTADILDTIFSRFCVGK